MQEAGLKYLKKNVFVFVVFMQIFKHSIFHEYNAVNRCYCVIQILLPNRNQQQLNISCTFASTVR